MDEVHKGFEELSDSNAALERVKSYSEEQFTQWQVTRLRSAMERYLSATLAAGLIEDQRLSAMVQTDIQLRVTDAFLDAQAWIGIKRDLVSKEDLLVFDDKRTLVESEATKRGDLLMDYMQIKAKDRDPSSATSLFNSHCQKSRKLQYEQMAFFIGLGHTVDLCRKRGLEESHIEPMCSECGGFGAILRE